MSSHNMRDGMGWLLDGVRIYISFFLKRENRTTSYKRIVNKVETVMLLVDP